MLLGLDLGQHMLDDRLRAAEVVPPVPLLLGQTWFECPELIVMRSLP